MDTLIKLTPWQCVQAVFGMLLIALVAVAPYYIVIILYNIIKLLKNKRCRKKKQY